MLNQPYDGACDGRRPIPLPEFREFMVRAGASEGAMVLVQKALKVRREWEAREAREAREAHEVPVGPALPAVQATPKRERPLPEWKREWLEEQRELTAGMWDALLEATRQGREQGRPGGPGGARALVAPVNLTPEQTARAIVRAELAQAQAAAAQQAATGSRGEACGDQELTRLLLGLTSVLGAMLVGLLWWIWRLV